jgi:hypothetical protein
MSRGPQSPPYTSLLGLLLSSIGRSGKAKFPCPQDHDQSADVPTLTCVRWAETKIWCPAPIASLHCNPSVACSRHGNETDAANLPLAGGARQGYVIRSQWGPEDGRGGERCNPVHPSGTGRLRDRGGSWTIKKLPSPSRISEAHGKQ